MNENTHKAMFWMGIWFLIAVLILNFYYVFSNIEMMKSDPCNLCEEMGEVCSPRIQVVEGLPQLNYDWGEMNETKE